MANISIKRGFKQHFKKLKDDFFFLLIVHVFIFNKYIIFSQKIMENGWSLISMCFFFFFIIILFLYILFF